MSTALTGGEFPRGGLTQAKEPSFIAHCTAQASGSEDTAAHQVSMPVVVARRVCETSWLSHARTTAWHLGCQSSERPFGSGMVKSAQDPDSETGRLAPPASRQEAAAN